MSMRAKLIGYIISLGLIGLNNLTLCRGMESASTAIISQECLLPKRTLAEGKLPSKYKICNVSQQLNFYREKVYNPALNAFNGNVDDLKSKPIPGLSLILENAFALVADYIEEDQRQNPTNKEQYVEEMRLLWSKAQSAENQLTSSFFQGFNKNLAYIIECYKNNQNVVLDNLICDNPLAYPNWLDIIFDRIKALKDEINTDSRAPMTMREFYTDLLMTLGDMIQEKETDDTFAKYGFKQCKNQIELLKAEYERREFDPEDIALVHYHNPNVENIIFIVYGNPNPNIKARNILPLHFVNQYFNENYSAYIAFFDILSSPKKIRTKKDPHWSKENGTLRMLMHDLNHITTQISSLTNLPELQYLKEIYQIQKNYKNRGHENEQTILMDGLFFLIHERPDLAKPDFTIEKIDINKYADHIASIMKRRIFNFKTVYGLSSYGSKYYKQENRDWEYMLKNKYFDQEENKFKPTHDKQGKSFLTIEYNPDTKKMTRPFADSSTRNRQMKHALVEGYARFWNYFIYLIQNAPSKA